MDHSYEEMRKIVIEVLAKGEENPPAPQQYESLKYAITRSLKEKGQLLYAEQLPDGSLSISGDSLSRNDSDILLEVFWDLFRQGIITLGCDDSNREFPFFRLSGFGKKIIKSQEPYFFYDISSYEKIILTNIPDIDSITLLYLKESMQAFLSGCILSSTVMVGVAVESLFLKLLETIEKNNKYYPLFKNVFDQKTILQKLNKFRNILEQNQSILTPELKEDLDTNFSGIMTMIRNFRNESGHPSGKIISREQCYILLQLFVPYCRKMYQLIKHF